MKWKIWIPVLLVMCLSSACFVYTYHPLYTQKDLFANDLILGEWMDSDSVIWRFDHMQKTFMQNEIKTDSTGYILRMKEQEKEWISKTMKVRLLKLNGHLFADFSLDSYFDENNMDFFDLHLMTVHTFAKVVINGDSLQLNWFNPEWFDKMVKGKKIRIEKEVSAAGTLVTASTKKLQKFAVKYANSPEAFEDGYAVFLKRKDN
jgi:hypothetical protein